MELPKVRKTAATYGKTNKKVLVHDFFEYRSSPEAPATTAVSELNLKSVATKPLMSSNEANRTLSPQSSPALSATSDVSGLATDPKSGKPPVIDVFDINSSEDDVRQGSREREANKRRRVNHSLQGGTAQRDARTATTALHSHQRTNGAHVTVAAPKKASVKPTQPGRKDGKEITKATRGPKSRSRDSSTLKVQSADTRPASQSTNHYLLEDGRADIQMPFDDYAAVDGSGHLTDQSTQSATGTPKRKRPMSQYSEGSVPSPSSLGFTSLKLTPERKVLPRKAMSPQSTSDEDETPRKVRSRLIDRLDAPQEKREMPGGGNSQSPDQQKPLVKSGTSKEDFTSDASGKNHLGEPRAALVPQADQPRVRATYGTKARTTYAKERSHLSDMTEDLNLLGVPASIDPVQHVSIQQATSNLALQLELDNGSDEDHSGSTKIKSIHELRKSGANNRSDREVQGLLEDIENEGTSNRSLRMQALIKLIWRSEDATFLRNFLDTGRWHRLTKAALASRDLVSTTLFAISLLMLSNAATAENAPRLFDIASKLAPQLLKTDDSLSKVASERKSNVSKLLVRDILALEDFLLQQPLASMCKQTPLSCSDVALVFLQQTLQKCPDPGIAMEGISKECYTEVVAVLNRHTQVLTADQDPEPSMARIGKAFEVLEAFSIASDTLDTILVDSDYARLGAALAELMTWAKRQNTEFNKRVLQATVNLSNNKPRTCRLLARTGVLEVIFTIINDHFRTVATQADHEETVDAVALDLVILALVCLLNFTESDAEARALIASSTASGHNHLEQLVDIFNSQASKVEEATTPEQSQVLVAVGYLSMVLCTISLNPLARQRIVKLLQNKSFGELCSAAETFFQHLCTLEEMSGEDGSMSAFIARFNAILQTVREPMP